MRVGYMEMLNRFIFFYNYTLFLRHVFLVCKSVYPSIWIDTCKHIMQLEYINLWFLEKKMGMGKKIPYVGICLARPLLCSPIWYWDTDPLSAEFLWWPNHSSIPQLLPSLPVPWSTKRIAAKQTKPKLSKFLNTVTKKNQNPIRESNYWGKKRRKTRIC